MNVAIYERLMLAYNTSAMTDKEMIRKAEISKSHWHNLQTNKTKNIKDETIVKLCEALNITTDWLLTGKGKMKGE